MMNNDLAVALNQIKANPRQFIAQCGFALPQNIPPTPNDIIQHFLNTGKVKQAQVNQAMQLRNSPMITQFFRRN